MALAFSPLSEGSLVEDPSAVQLQGSTVEEPISADQPKGPLVEDPSSDQPDPQSPTASALIRMWIAAVVVVDKKVFYTFNMYDNIPTEIIHPNVKNLPGLLLPVVLAIHSAVNHQTTWANCGKWGILEKDFQWASKCSSLVVCGLGRVEKNWICKIRRWLPSTISELAWRLLLRSP